MEIKEINIKIEKFGTVHYYGLACENELNPEVCEDCGQTVTRYNKIMWGKRDEGDSLIWKIVCHECSENYRTEDKGFPEVIKLGNYNNEPLSRTFKPHKPYLSKCCHCKEELDLYKVPLYQYKEGSYCVDCLKEVFGVDFTKHLPPLFIPVEDRRDEDIFEELYAKLDAKDKYGQMLLRKLETIVIPTNSIDGAYRDCYSEKVDVLEAKYFKTYDNIIVCLNELELNDIYKGSQGRDENENYTLTCKKVPTEILIEQSWCDEKAKVRINEEGQIEMLHDMPHGPRYLPTLYFIKKVERKFPPLGKKECVTACPRCDDDTPVCAC